MSSNPILNTRPPRLILASSSPYRQLLLERLRLPFKAVAPSIDETPRAGEPPVDLVRRLAEAKAKAIRPAWPEALIIGSDQVAICNGEVLGKPRDFDMAKAQLVQIQGRRVGFITGLCLLNGKTGRVRTDTVSYVVHLRPLTLEQI